MASNPYKRRGTKSRVIRATRPGASPDQKRRRKVIRYTIGAAGLLLLILFFFVGDGYYYTMRYKSEVAAIGRRLDSLRRTNGETKELVGLLKANDPLVLEEEARRIGLVKPGETVYILKYEDEE